MAVHGDKTDLHPVGLVDSRGLRISRSLDCIDLAASQKPDQKGIEILRPGSDDDLLRTDCQVLVLEKVAGDLLAKLQDPAARSLCQKLLPLCLQDLPDDLRPGPEWKCVRVRFCICQVDPPEGFLLPSFCRLRQPDISCSPRLITRPAFRRSIRLICPPSFYGSILLSSSFLPGTSRLSPISAT